MRILITGNMGYVGSVLTRYLKEHFLDAKIIGYDAGFFGHSLTGVDALPETLLAEHYYADVRDFNPALLKNIDAVVHLAAVSNDPMGKEFEKVTSEINREASVAIAKVAIDAGVKNFVFASSCSMYGQAEGGPRRETDPTNPLTAYAHSKIGTETDVQNLNLKDMVFTSLRFATACGMSDRLRLDLVLNDFVACAISAKEITVLSDGSPWRPLIDVEDMARVISWAIRRNKNQGEQFLAVNAGRDEGNYQVKDLAEAVAKHIPGTTVSINKDAPPDKRSYKVDFTLFKSLAPEFLPKVSLDESIIQLKNGFERMKFKDINFRDSPFMRLNTLRRHINNKTLTNNLRWTLKNK
jgi:nucleoside-diphosphate-sugar epimerase